MKTETTNQYDVQSESFLARFNIAYRATLSDSKPCPFSKSVNGFQHHYRVTLSKPRKSHLKAFDVLKNGKVIDTVFYNNSPVKSDEVLRSLQNHDGVDCDAVREQRTRGNRLTFDFWGSIADAEKGVTDLRPYHVLACISGDVYCPDKFEDFCAEYGYSNDSIEALQIFRRASKFAARLKAFFTKEEIEALQEIQ